MKCIIKADLQKDSMIDLLVMMLLIKNILKYEIVRKVENMKLLKEMKSMIFI